MSGWRPDAGPDLRQAAALLSTSDLTVEGRLPWSSNLTFLVSLEGTGRNCPDGTDERPAEERRDRTSMPLLAVYKPHRGEQSLWDFPDGLYRREVAAYALSEALGWGLVPPTVIRPDGPFGPGSVQLFVEADYAQHYFTLLEGGARDHDLMAVAAFDVVANNADRKSGHVLLGPEDRLWAIDHGLCFHHQHKLRTVIWEFGGEEVPAAVLAELRRLLTTDLPAELIAQLSESEAEALQERATRLVGDGVFPEPSGDRPPYPWPLV